MHEKFANHTVLTVVHKLESALEDFDMVVVLDAGKLLEMGDPRDLVKKGTDGSAFAALYESLAAKKGPGAKEAGEDVIASISATDSSA
jgi:ABC-type multidrug transport system fused ATPase/permease subunit